MRVTGDVSWQEGLVPRHTAWQQSIANNSFSGRQLSTVNVPSIPIRRAERKVRPIRPRRVHGSGKRWPSEQSRTIRAQPRIYFRDSMRPVGVEERRRGRAIGQREVRTRGPGSVGELLLEPGIRELELLLRICAYFPLSRVTLQCSTYRVLHPVHDVQIEEANEKTNIERTPRIFRQEPHRTGMPELSVFDEDGSLDDAAPIVDQQRELTDGPSPLPFGHVMRRVRPEQAELVRSLVLIERDEHLLRIGGEGVTVERKRHRETASIGAWDAIDGTE